MERLGEGNSLNATADSQPTNAWGPGDLSALDTPVFVLSVDFELLWGYVFYPQDRAVALLRSDETWGRRSTLALLEILDRHRLPATWATVGNLFLDPNTAHRSRYPGSDLRSSVFGQADGRLFHAPDLIEKIRGSATGHEIGFHSFSHVRFSECGADIAQHELREGMRVAEAMGLRFRSFVFPENKIGHTTLLKAAGFVIYRGRNLGGRGVEHGIGARAKGLVMRRVTAPPVMPIARDGIWEVPGSMLFFDSLVPSAVVSRATRALRAAIKRKMIFHLWLHPQDLLLDPHLARRLDAFLARVAERRDRGEIELMTMGRLGSALAARSRPHAGRVAGT